MLPLTGMRCSEHRLARALQMPEPASRAQVLAILGDTADPQYPIYRWVATRAPGVASVA